MLKLDYKICRTEVCDCMMGVIENTALYFCLNYEYLYSGIWVFRFSPQYVNYEPFWKRLSTPELLNSHIQIEQYHGLAIRRKELLSFQKFKFDMIEQLLNGKPIAVCVNAFYCPWSGVYQKYPLLHFCALVGFDKDRNVVLCADPYFMEDIRPWPMDELEMSIYHYYIFEIVPPTKDLSNWKNDIKVCAADKIYNNVFEQMNYMKQEIIHDSNFIEEMKKQNDQYSFELFYQMKYISHSRYNHAEFLRYIIKMVPEARRTNLLESALLLEEASSLWRTIGLVFTKLAYMHKQERIYKYLNQIAERTDKCIALEQQAANIIMNI